MGYHGVKIFRLSVKPNGLAALFLASREGFFLFVCPLRGVLLRLFLDYFAFFCRVTGDMLQAYYCTGWPIALMACIFVFCLLERPFLRLVRKEASPPLHFLP